MVKTKEIGKYGCISVYLAPFNLNYFVTNSKQDRYIVDWLVFEPFLNILHIEVTYSQPLIDLCTSYYRLFLIGRGAKQ